MTWNNQSVTQLIVEEQTQGVSGFFGYSPNVGKGNLSFSVAAASGVDGTGNDYPSGMGMTGVPAVWYGAPGAAVSVVQAATLTITGRNIAGSFASNVTAGNAVLAVIQTDSNTTGFYLNGVTFNSVAMNFPDSNPDGTFMQWNDGAGDNIYFGYLANVSTGKALAGTLSATPAFSVDTGGYMVEVSGLGTSIAATSDTEFNASSTSFTAGGVAPPGSPAAIYLGALVTGGPVPSDGRMGWVTGGVHNANGYLIGAGEQDYSGDFSPASFWFAGIAAFWNGNPNPAGVVASVSPVNTVDSVTGTVIPAGLSSGTVTSTVGLLNDASGTTGQSCFLYYFGNASTGTGTLFALGNSGNLITIATT